jgi:hypothetical protein
MLQQILYVTSISRVGVARGASEGGPLGHNGLQGSAGSEAGVTGDAEHKAVSMGVVADAEHEAQRSTKLHLWAVKGSRCPRGG